MIEKDALKSMVMALDDSVGAEKMLSAMFGDSDSVFTRIAGHIMDAIGSVLYGEMYDSNAFVKKFYDFLMDDNVSADTKATVLMNEAMIPAPRFFSEYEKEEMAEQKGAYVFGGGNQP